MLYENENWHWIDLPQFKSGDEFVLCFFTREVKGTKIMVGLTDLSFIDCGLGNCDIPPDSETAVCNTCETEYSKAEVETEIML